MKLRERQILEESDGAKAERMREGLERYKRAVAPLLEGFDNEVKKIKRRWLRAKGPMDFASLRETRVRLAPQRQGSIGGRVLKLFWLR